MTEHKNTAFNGPETLVIVLHEIYGVNNHILTTVEKFKQLGFAAVCPDLAGLADSFAYDCQQEAYTHFMNNVGFAEASLQVRELSARAKNDGYKKVILCGFSVGATIAWLCSRDKNVDGVICYYGSRIRDYPEINPSCPSLLIFPEQEESLDVISFAASIMKPGVKVTVLAGRHGFADRFSPNYSEASSLQADMSVKSFLAGLD